MSRSRILIVLVGPIVGLGLLCSSAQARSSNRNNQNGGGYEGLISGKSQSEREQELRKQEQEAQKKKQEELKAKKDAEQKAAADKKKAQDDARKQAAQAAKKPAASSKVASAKPTPGKGATGKGGAAKDTVDADKAAEKLVQEAEKQFEGDNLLPGVALLRQTIKDYGTTKAAEQAQTRLDQLLSMPDLGPAILLGEAEELFGQQRYRRALSRYNELINRFPDGEQAKDAAKRVAEIRDGDLLSKTAYTEEELEDARLWFLTGNIHIENGRAPEAVSAWRRVVEEYPGCHFAQLAVEKLKSAPSS